MCSPVDVSRLRIRKFDGFDTWDFLDWWIFRQYLPKRWDHLKAGSFLFILPDSGPA
jgi:hypothetical protein